MNVSPIPRAAGISRRLLAGAAALSLAACASGPPVRELPVFLNHGPVRELPDVDVLALSARMQAFLDRYVLSEPNLDLRVTLLTTAVVDPAMLGFSYQESRTLTAREAFESRSGNCVAFANLMVAMARASGLKATYQEVVRLREWSSQDDTLLLLKHINVILESPSRMVTVDVSGMRAHPGDQRRPLPDREALALYYNNLGAESLLASDLPEAYEWFHKALEAAPRLSDSWINLGVVYGRNRQYEEAARLYRTAMRLPGSDSSAVANLYEVDLVLGNEREAADLEKRVERYRRRNPYYLLSLGEQALDEARYADAIDLFEQAIERKPDEHRFHFELARAQFLLGNTQAAEASLERARELAPVDLVAFYAKPMAELVHGN